MHKNNQTSFDTTTLLLVIVLIVFGYSSNAMICAYNNPTYDSMTAYNESQKVEKNKTDPSPALTKNIDPLLMQ